MSENQSAQTTYVLEDLSEEEAYLYAILSDVSGLDQAEFLWFDESSQDNLCCRVCGSSVNGAHRWDHGTDYDDLWVVRDDMPAPTGCFRAWAFQWQWWRSTDNYQIDQSSRSVGKSLSVKVRACAFPFVHPGAEMIVTAPELVHLEPITGLIEDQFERTRTLNEMMPKGRGKVTHRPFQMNFLNGARIIGRIPQRDGRGVKGIHPIWLEQDEAQDWSKAGWTELRETLKRGFAGSLWRAHGVTRGIHDDFYEATQDTPDNIWKVHRFPAMWRPNWTDLERREKVEQYGSREDPDYRRNVLGLHGDRTNPIFVLTQLMKNVDVDDLSDFNQNEYYHVTVKKEQLELMDSDVLDMIDFPAGHLTYAGNIAERRTKPKAHYWIGMDVGYTVDPSEILVFVEYRHGPKDPKTRLKLLSRISMVRLTTRQQLMAMLAAIDFYNPKVFAIDKIGVGGPLYDALQEMVKAIRSGHTEKVPPEFSQFASIIEQALTNTVKGYGFSEKLLVDVDQAVDVGLYEDALEVAGIRKNAKEYSTDVLRELVDDVRLELPYDKDLLNQFNGATWTSTKGFDHYGRRQFSKGNDHCLDAARLMALGWAQFAIEEMQQKPKHEPVFDSFIAL